MPEKTCLNCAKNFTFTAGRGHQPELCSDECRTEHNRRRRRAWHQRQGKKNRHDRLEQQREQAREMAQSVVAAVSGEGVKHM